MYYVRMLHIFLLFDVNFEIHLYMEVILFNNNHHHHHHHHDEIRDISSNSDIKSGIIMEIPNVS